METRDFHLVTRIEVSKHNIALSLQSKCLQTIHYNSVSPSEDSASHAACSAQARQVVNSR